MKNRFEIFYICLILLKLSLLLVNCSLCLGILLEITLSILGGRQLLVERNGNRLSVIIAYYLGRTRTRLNQVDICSDKLAVETVFVRVLSSKQVFSELLSLKKRLVE